MEFTRAYLQEMLPREDPPLPLVPQAVIGAYSERKLEDDGLVRRSALWTYAIFSEIRDFQFDIVPDRYRLDEPIWYFRDFWRRRHRPLFWPEIAVGVLDPAFEGAGFGLTFSVPGTYQSRQVGRVHFPRLDASFPLASLALVDDQHAPPCPSNSMSACWAEDNLTGGWGVVTCRHSMRSVSPGATLLLTGGQHGTLDRKADPPIDAAYVTTPCAVPPTATMTTDHFPAAGLAVEVMTGNGPVTRSVVSTMDTLGILNDPAFPVRVFLDKPCVSGDSGSLVRDRSGIGVGIYSGGRVAPRSPVTGQQLGYAQLLEQAAQILDVTPYL